METFEIGLPITGSSWNGRCEYENFSITQQTKRNPQQKYTKAITNHQRFNNKKLLNHEIIILILIKKIYKQC